MLHCVSICINSKIVSQIFKIIFLTGYIIFNLRSFIYVLHFQIRISSRSEKELCGKKVYVYYGRILKDNCNEGRTWSSAKLFVLAINAAIADRDVFLTVENL